VLAATADSIRATGARVEAVAGDVSRRDDVPESGRAVRPSRRAVQVAGIADFLPFLDVTDESWERILGVNLKGTWYLVQEAGRAMVNAGTRGAIVVTSSTNAFSRRPEAFATTRRSPGQVAVMHTAALELSRHGIRVNAIAPGIINTRSRGL